MLPHPWYGRPQLPFQQNRSGIGATQGESLYELNPREQKLVEAAYTRPDVDVGKYYPCDPEDIDIVYSPPTHPVGRLPQPLLGKVSVGQAISDLKVFNSLPVEACVDKDQVFPTLDEYLFNCPSIRSRDVPGLVFKAFRDLDSAFFQSCLFGRVQLMWAGTGHIQRLNPRIPPGDARGCTYPNGGKIKINLCVDALLLRRNPSPYPYRTILEETLKTLLHEMLVSHTLSSLRSCCETTLTPAN